METHFTNHDLTFSPIDFIDNNTACQRADLTKNRLPFDLGNPKSKGSLFFLLADYPRTN